MGFILYPVPPAQIIHPDFDLKAMSTFHSSFWRTDFFSQVFAKNGLIKNIFEKEKSLIVEHYFMGEIVSYLVQSDDVKLTKELSEKVQYPHNRQSKTN